MKYKIFGTVSKQDFFLKQFNPINFKNYSVPVPETQYLSSAGVNKI